MAGIKNDAQYNDDMKGIAISQFGFERRIEDDALYVDKTRYIYDLVRSERGNFFFLSRPRRYGKSLFCYTLHSLFEGRKELFKGLYIAEKTDYDFPKYPVLHFDFSGMDLLNEEYFMSSFRSMVRWEAEHNGITIQDDAPAAMLQNLINELYQREGDIVIIIDEFDAPITSSINKIELTETIRAAFNAFYATIKKNILRIRFFFITGVTKLQNLSIFSAMNNLVDISMDPDFAAAFGYTEEELDQYFGEGIDEYLETHDVPYTKEDFRKKIKDYYDGYRFSQYSDITVYNPVSIGMLFICDFRFDNYWEATGVSTLVVNLASSFDLADILGDTISVPIASFRTFDISEIQQKKLNRNSVVALLYYAGYLTICGYEDQMVYLRFPNVEVGSCFTDNLLARYTYDMDGSEVEMWLFHFMKACKAGDEEKAMELLETYFEAFSYELIGKNPEKHYQAIFHAIFIIAGIRAISEDRGIHGRAEEAIIADNHIWIFELKVDGSADAALKQMQDRGYADKYLYLLKPGMEIHRIGISFSSKERKISEWKSLDR